MIARLVPGGAWFVSHVEADGRSSLGRFAWRHRHQLLRAAVTMPGAAAVSAMVDGLRIAPVSGVAGSVLSAAIAGVLAVSPRLRLEVSILTRAAGSAVKTMLAAIGGAVAVAVFSWDKLGPTTNWMLNEAVARLRAEAPAIFSNLLIFWLIGCAMRSAFLGSRSGQIRRALRFDRKMAARHEAAHALVASVLGLPLKGAWVLRDLDDHGVGGGVTLAPPPAISAAEPIYGLLARALAVSVAGVAGACGARPMPAILRELECQSDWIQAKELSWIAASLRPDRVLVQDVLNTLVPALHTAPWTAAIAAAAKVLLRAGGDPVSPETFAVIARRFGLTLPAVKAIADAVARPLSPATQEIVACC